MAAVARSPSSTSSHYSLPHPPARRPSTLRRNSSSSSILLSPVPRFSPEEPTQIPQPVYYNRSETNYDARPTTQQRTSFAGPLAGAQRPPIKPTPSGSSGSLLQRRKSSAGAAGRERPSFSLTTLKLDELPNPMAKLPTELDRLDDTVPKEVIGFSSAAVTPETPSEGQTLVEESFKPTRSFVATPFPEKKSFIGDDDDEDEEGSADEEEQEQKDSRVQP